MRKVMAITFTGLGSKEDPIRISGISTNFEAISAEYKYLNQKYGERGVDWKLLRQALVNDPNGPICDILYIELTDGTNIEVWIDITD